MQKCHLKPMENRIGDFVELPTPDVDRGPTDPPNFISGIIYKDNKTMAFYE